MTITIPDTPAGLEDMLSDPTKMQAVFSDKDGFKSFVTAYAKTVLNKDQTIATQVREQVQNTLAEYLKDNALTGGVGAGPNIDLSANGNLAARPARNNRGQVYNKRAPGAAIDSSPDVSFADPAEFFQATWHNSDGLRNATELAGKREALRKIQNSFGSVVPADGGFLIPEVLRSEIMKVALESAVVRSRATVIPMESLKVPIPMVDSTSNASSLYGGIICYWTEESAALTESQASFGRVTLDAKKLTAYACVPNELVADASAFNGFFDAAFPAAVAFYEDYAFLRGTGVGEPLGLINADAAIIASAVSGQGANTIVWENIVAMYARMLPSSLGTAVWLVSPDTFPQLATMALSVGTGGAPVWLVNGQDGAPTTLLGRPVIVTEKVPSLGTTGDIAFVDLAYYLIGDRMAMQSASSTDYRFGNDQTAFRVIERVDGRPWIQSAITPKNGGSTLSPFVQLSSTRT
jgi:HK97 family phage major capsid protein